MPGTGLLGKVQFPRRLLNALFETGLFDKVLERCTDIASTEVDSGSLDAEEVAILGEISERLRAKHWERFRRSAQAYAADAREGGASVSVTERLDRATSEPAAVSLTEFFAGAADLRPEQDPEVDAVSVTDFFADTPLFLYEGTAPPPSAANPGLTFTGPLAELKHRCFFVDAGACDALMSRLRGSMAALDVKARQADARRQWNSAMADQDRRRDREWLIHAQGQADSWTAELERSLAHGDLDSARRAAQQVQRWSAEASQQ